MTKFVPLAEAAKLLGMSSDELVEARDRNEIHGYRDGSSWKFKMEEIERFASENNISLGSAGGDDDDDSLLIPDLLGTDDDESILVTEEPLDAPRSSSTIIGAKKGESASTPASESDLVLAGDDADPLASGDSGIDVLGSDVLSSGSSKIKSASDSDVQLVLDDDGSDVKVVPGSSNLLGDVADDDSDLKINLSGSTGTGELDVLGGSGSGPGTDELDDLSLSDDEELILSGTGTGSDVTMGASDTGINLASPSDSGLSLDDEALDLGSVSSLELPEDDDALVSLDDGAEPVVQKDEDFMLSPAGEAIDDEDTSGSQIIELDTTFDMPAEAGEAVEGLEEAPLGAVAPVTDAGVRYAAPPPEVPMSLMAVLFLFCTVSMLTLSGILMFDVIRNMWSWDEGTSQSMASSLMDGIVNALKLNQ